MDADGSNVRQLTSNGAMSLRPSWSPDGSRLAFESNAGGDFDIYVAGADGSDQVKLLDLPGDQRAPEWSRTGDAIVFRSDHDGNDELYMASPDGSSFYRLTRNPAVDTDASWSPLLPASVGVLNNAALAYTSAQTGNHDIFLMNADGSVRAQLTENPASDREPSWSPDGSRLAFVSNRDGGWEVYTIGSNGLDARRLTDNDVIEGARQGGRLMDGALRSGRSGMGTSQYP